MGVLSRLFIDHPVFIENSSSLIKFGRSLQQSPLHIHLTPGKGISKGLGENHLISMHPPVELDIPQRVRCATSSSDPGSHPQGAGTAHRLHQHSCDNRLISARETATHDSGTKNDTLAQPLTYAAWVTWIADFLSSLWNWWRAQCLLDPLVAN